MKIAVGLFGIHYLNNLNHWMGWDIYVDYKEGYSINNNILYNNYDVDFYSSTYFSEKINNLIDDFKFETLQLKHVDNTPLLNLNDNWKKRNRRFKETIKLILESNINYDYVILTRYDIEFLENPLNLNFDKNKINVICKLYSSSVPYIVDDNFYILSYENLNEFYNSICDIDETIWAHNYYEYIDNFNFLVDGIHYTHNMPVYKFLRKGK